MTAPGWGVEPPRPEPPPDRPGEAPDAADSLPSAPRRPPGGGIFTLEGRRAPGLYLVAWLLTSAGLVLTFLIGPQASSQTAGLVLMLFGVVLTTLGLGAGAGSQVMERQDRHPERYRGPSPVLTFLAYYFAVSLIGLAAVAVGYDGTQSPMAFLGIGLVQTVAYVVVVWLFAVRSGALSWSDMGWPTWQGREPTEVVISIVMSAFLMVPVTFAILILAFVVGTILDAEAPSVLPPISTSLDALAVAIVAAFLIPIGEEVLFRGLAMTAWRRDLGDRTALIRSSVFFAVVHLLNIPATDASGGIAQAILQVVVILPVGLALGWMFLRRGLIGSITAHATYNLILLLGLFAANENLG